MLLFLYAFCFNLYCGGFILFCNVCVCVCVCVRMCVCVGFVMCVFVRVLQCVGVLLNVHFTLTEVFPCFLLRCKANARLNFQRRDTAHTIPH